MSDLKTGEVDWNDVDPTQLMGRGQFLSLKEVGDHRIRIISKPHQYFARWVPDATGKDVKISCQFKADCKVCRPRMGDKNPQTRWYCLVIDRSNTDESHPSGKVRILDMGIQIFGSIRSLHQDPDWGDVKKYDVKINRGPKGSNPLYTIKPVGQKSGFTDQEKVMAKEVLTPGSEQHIDLMQMCEPMSCEETHKLLTGATGGGTTTTASDDSFGFGQNAEGGGDLDFLDDDSQEFDESQKSPSEGAPVAAADDDDDDFLELS